MGIKSLTEFPSKNLLEIMKETEKYVAIITEPLPNITPEQWLERHNNAETEKELADAYAGASNEAWWLDDETYDTDCADSIKILCKEWFHLVDRLIKKLLQIAKRENSQGEFQQTPIRKWLTPIMLRNGYRDADGWWIPVVEDNH